MSWKTEWWKSLLWNKVNKKKILKEMWTVSETFEATLNAPTCEL